MKPITLDIGNIQITLKSALKNKAYHCTSHFCDHCDVRKQMSLDPLAQALIATEAIFNVRNLSGKAWSVPLGNWELIDTDGYAFGGKPLCDALRPLRTIVPGHWDVSPGTQVDFVLVFPELEADREIARVMYCDKGGFYVFPLNDLKPEAAELLRTRATSLTEIDLADFETRQMLTSINSLEANIHARLNNVLIPKEATKLENDINERTFSVGQGIKFFHGETRKMFEDRVHELVTHYASAVEVVRAREKERKAWDQRVEKLNELSPREFEEYIAQLFEALGYQNVTLTPASNDKGIDVLAEHNGIKVAIQCKKYKGVVGSPLIQTFLGAMRHAGAHKGLFITTSTFSIEAERMASEHPIELIDGGGLAALIQMALSMKQSTQTKE